MGHLEDKATNDRFLLEILPVVPQKRGAIREVVLALPDMVR